jgi:hypothetical protein
MLAKPHKKRVFLMRSGALRSAVRNNNRLLGDAAAGHEQVAKAHFGCPKTPPVGLNLY